MGRSDLREEITKTGAFFLRASKRPSDQLEVFRALRDLEQRAQIKRISLAENSSREIQESGINPDKTSLNLISSFGSRSEQISASRKPLFLDTTWASKEVEGELTTGKQLTRVFNGLLEENTTEDTAMTTTINFDDLLLEESVFVSTSIAPMDMIEEENLMIENTGPLSEDTTNIMEMIENATFDFTLPEPFPTTSLHITEHKAEVEQMVEVNDAAETFSTWTSLDDANLGLCLPAIEAEGRIELPVSVVGNNNVESSEADDLLKWIMDDNQIADFNFPNEGEEATTSFLIEEVKVEMGKATKANKRSRVKMEELTQEEKYRRMREQNNRASQACMAKRKRKLAEEEQELTILQEKNIHLQAVFKSMQEEVALYKKRILEQVSGVRN